MQKKSKWFFLLGIIILAGGIIPFIWGGSDDTSYPRPRGYFRIDFPEKKYEPIHDSLAPFSFETPWYSNIANAETDGTQWKANLQFGWYNATLHCFYIKDSNLAAHVDFAREMAYTHKEMARKIEPVPLLHPENDTYGLMYEIEGEKVASNYSFYLIDSVNQYFRGALYFNQKPNSDSLAPVIDYLKADIDHLISTFKWDAKIGK